MSTPNEITTVIASTYGRETDTPFKYQLYERVKYWRARLISNSLDRNPNTANHYQTTLMVPMMSKDGYSISKCPIPKSMDRQSFPSGAVMSGDGSQVFTYTPPGTQRQLTSGKYSGLTPSYDLLSDRKLVVFREGICDILINTILDTPEDAPKCENENCDWWNSPIDISTKLLQQITQAIENESKTGQVPSQNVAVPTDERGV